MSNFARWEQESRQPLGPLQPDIPHPDPSHRFQETMEVDMSALLDEQPLAPDLFEDEAADAALPDSTALHEIAEIHELLDDDEDGEDGEESGRARAAAARTLQGTGEKLTDARRSIATTGRTIGRWMASLDRRPEFSLHHGHDPIAQLNPGEPPADEIEPADSPAPAEDREAYIARLEAELAQLRAGQAGEGPVPAPISITEEIERIGEETASILVVAHDKAHETARRAQEQAERRVRDADARAEATVAEAQRRLRELDAETDAVWRERERLLEDVRTVCGALSTLVEDAGRRFPADPEPMADAEIVPEPVAADEGTEVEAGATAEG